MPLVTPSTYRPPFGLGNGHLQTIYPALFRRPPLITDQPERLELPDGDFLDLHWRRTPGARRLAILSHGLEGGARNAYIQGMAAALHRAHWDILAWDYRGCGAEPNRLLRSYHSGATEDLAAVIDHALAPGHYPSAALIGFSLGGNLTLKYLGDHGPGLPAPIRRAVTFSVPCDLAASSAHLEHPGNRLYMDRFLITLRAKIRAKIARFPGQLHDHGLDAMRTFREFDGAYTAPLHGYRDAADYWARASSRPVLSRITIPTLLIQARNDPFLPPQCYPEAEARASAHLHLETPPSGGHLGFLTLRAPADEYWSETRACAFLSST